MRDRSMLADSAVYMAVGDRGILQAVVVHIQKAQAKPQEESTRGEETCAAPCVQKRSAGTILGKEREPFVCKVAHQHGKSIVVLGISRVDAHSRAGLSLLTDGSSLPETHLAEPAARVMK